MTENANTNMFSIKKKNLHIKGYHDITRNGNKSDNTVQFSHNTDHENFIWNTAQV